jgi:hypothetical protein
MNFDKDTGLFIPSEFRRARNQNPTKIYHTLAPYLDLYCAEYNIRQIADIKKVTVERVRQILLKCQSKLGLIPPPKTIEELTELHNLQQLKGVIEEQLSYEIESKAGIEVTTNNILSAVIEYLEQVNAYNS